MSVKIEFPYKGYSPVYIPEKSLLAILKPKTSIESDKNEIDQIRSALRQPIGTPPLREFARKHRKILILVDDYTRNTPAELIIPLVLEELRDAGILPENIKFMIASGLHRKMTEKEKLEKVGKSIMQNYKIMDHDWQNPDALLQLPTTSGGTEIWVNKETLAADFIIGIGHIVPTRVVGFSGGAKIIQPGVCGAVTTGQTHWLSALYSSEEIFGIIDNPIRREIDEVGRMAGLKFIVNTIHDATGKISRCVCGDPIKAFQSGCKTTRDIYGVPLSEPADIVLIDSYPGDMELWQAGKAIFAAEQALKKNGVLILIAPCSEGVCKSHPQLADVGYMPFAEIKALVDQGKFKDLTLASHIAKVGHVIFDKGTAVLVSDGVDPEMTRKLGFTWAKTAEAALEFAFKLKGPDAKVVVIQHGGEVMPVLNT